MITVVNCVFCGKEVKCNPSRIKKSKTICCSRECRSLYSKSLVKYNVHCANCGKLFYIKPYHLNKYKTHCCSYKCSGEFKSRHNTGEKNPNYGNRALNNPMTKETRITNHGYRLVICEDHPFRINNFWIKEHRLIAEKYIMTNEQAVCINDKLYLNPKLDVHHINGDKLDNRVENLIIMTRSEHCKVHAKTRSHKRKK